MYNSKNKHPKKNGLLQIKKPLAMAMWDFSWLLRHHRMGEFENWDRVLDELSERGYDAIRIDCFPHLIASDNNGDIIEEFYCPKEDWIPPLWGNQYSVKIRPGEGILDFLTKCRQRGIRVGLSTWFMSHGTGRNEIFSGEEGLIRAWDETLKFLEKNKLLEDILYVDILNEYPLNNGFNWLKKAMIADSRKINIEDVEFDSDGKEHLWSPEKGGFSTDYNFHCNFLNDVVEKLKTYWPNLDFFASLTPHCENMSWYELADISEFDVLDMHLWFALSKSFNEATKVWEYISLKNDMKYARSYRLIKKYWNENKTDAVKWMDSRVRSMRDIANRHNIPCGNTEGWGAVVWMDHPDLDWDFIKEAAEICADLGVKYGFKFNCTSNFTHPQFPGLWNDIKWHKKVTSIIKNGN